jgi:hypothetical protein
VRGLRRFIILDGRIPFRGRDEKDWLLDLESKGVCSQILRSYPGDEGRKIDSDFIGSLLVFATGIDLFPEDFSWTQFH